MTDETPEAPQHPAGAPKLSPEAVEAMKLLMDDQPAASDGRPIKAWLYRHVVGPLRRRFWILRLPDFIRYRLELQDQQKQQYATMQEAMLLMAKQQKQMAGFLADVRQRLLHHENGPLQASRRELDRRRGDGMVKPIDAKRNGAKSKPSKILDATGKAVEAPEQIDNEKGP